MSVDSPHDRHDANDETGRIAPAPHENGNASLVSAPQHRRRRWLGLCVVLVVGALAIVGTALWVHRIQTAAPGTLIQ